MDSGDAIPNPQYQALLPPARPAAMPDPALPLKERIHEATDALRLAKMHRLGYDRLAAHARIVLALRMAAEQAMGGRVRTTITARSIASLIR